MHGIGAVVSFVTVLFVWRAVFVKRGNMQFWQLAASQPDAAFEWCRGRSDWIVMRPSDPKVEQFKSDTGFLGPFTLMVPSVGGTVVMFAENSSLNSSQKEFVELFGGREEEVSFPWISSIALIYPIAAMLMLASHKAPFLPTLGNGFASLGYLLAIAGILAGRFGVLGMRYRIPTLIAAVVVWIAGMILLNM